MKELNPRPGFRELDITAVSRLNYLIVKELTNQVGLLLIAPGLRSRFSPGVIFYVKGLVGCAVGAAIVGTNNGFDCQACLGASR